MRAAVIVVSAVLLVSCGGGALQAGSPDSVGSVAATVPATTWDWLAPFGAEEPAPLVPNGWKVLDFEEFRFAVPADWTVPIWQSCLTASPGVVLVSTPAKPTSGCESTQPLPASVLTIGPADGNSYQVTASGPEADRVLATFTDSGIRRVLQTGNEADTTGWHAVGYSGLAFLVPTAWPVVDLPASVVEQESNGKSQMSWISNPDACGMAMFSNGRGESAYLGTSPPPSCPAGLFFDLEPNDGLWIRSISNEEAQTLGTPVARGVVGGLDVTVVRIEVSQYNRAPSSVLDLIVRNGATPMWISLGVGTDPSIARSILRSLHAT